MNIPFLPQPNHELREASDPSTAPERLRELGKAPVTDAARAVASNPNAPLDVLLRLSSFYAPEFMRNPVLPLLLLEAPDLGLRIPDQAALRMLALEDAPLWLVRAFARRIFPLGQAARLHLSTSGECGAAWEAEAHRALRRLLEHRVQSLLSQLIYGSAASARLHASAEMPPWLLAPLLQALRTQSHDTLRRPFQNIEPDPPDADDDQPGPAPAGVTGAQGDSQRALEQAALEPDAAPSALHALAQSGAGAAVARHPNTPPATLKMLASDASPAVRRRVARHESTPPESLRVLSNNSERAVRVAAARNPSTPRDVLEARARDEDPFVRGGVARNEAAEPLILELLARDEHAAVRFDVARHPSTPRPALEALCEDQDGAILDALARREDLSPELRARIKARRAVATQRRTWRLPKRVARDPSTPVEYLVELARSTVVSARRGAALNPNLPLEILCSLAQDPESLVAQGVAASPRTPPDVLDKLAQSDSIYVRQSVAGNPSAPVAALLRLADDNDRHSSMPTRVAANPALPLEALEMLAAKEDDRLDEGLARHPALPASLIEAIAQRANVHTLDALAQHPNAHRELKARLHDQIKRGILDYYVGADTAMQRAVEVSQPDAASKLFNESMESGDWITRLAVARGPVAWPGALQVLARDGNRLVRAAARAALESL